MQPFLFNWTSSRDQMKTFSFEVYRTDTCQELDEDDLIAASNTIDSIRKAMEKKLAQIFDTPFIAMSGKPASQEYQADALLKANRLEKKFTSSTPWKTYVNCERPNRDMSSPCVGFSFFDTEDGAKTHSGKCTFTNSEMFGSW